MYSSLDQLCRVAPDVQAAALIASDGTIESIRAPQDVESVLSPIVTTLTTVAQQTSQELGRGGLSRAVIEGHQGTVVVQDVDGRRCLAVVTSPHARLGLLLDDIQACAEGLAAEGFHA